MKKKVYALIFAAMLALSAAACNNNSGSSSSAPASDKASAVASTEESTEASTEGNAESSAEASTESAAESKAEASTAASEEESKAEESSSAGDADSKIGPKTLAAFSAVSGDTFTFDLEMTSDGAAEESGMTAVQTANMKIVKKGDVTRSITDVGITKIDVLVNSTGAYMLNSDSKIAYFAGNEESLVNTSNMDFNSLAESLEDSSTKYLGTGEEELEGKKYTYEAYSGTGSEGFGALTSSTEEATEIKFYFEGNDLRYVTINSGAAKITAKVKELSATADESLLTLPSDYLIKDISELYGGFDISDVEIEDDASAEDED